jgi:hypothetical protein
MYPSTVCFNKYGRKAANMDKETANTITPLKRHWYGFVYCNIRLNNRVSNAFAFILFFAEFISVFQEVNPAIHYNLDRQTPALKDFHCHQG